MINLSTASAQYVKGVGPKRIKFLERLDVATIDDLLRCFPRRYEDRSHLKPISEVQVGNFETVKGKVLAKGVRRTRRIPIFQLAVRDKTGVIYAVWFNQPYLKKFFKLGDEIILSGKVEWFKQLQFNSPDYEILSGAGKDTIHTGRIVPIYPLTRDLNQRTLRTIIKNALDKYLDCVKEPLNHQLRARRRLVGLQSAIINIHFPRSLILKDKARERLIFDEFFFLELGLALRRLNIRSGQKGIAHKLKGNLIKEYSGILPFKLTPAQQKVIDEIRKDMADTRPMNRLLQGDVGSGKTVVAVFSLLAAIENGYQGAIMVPTEILAEQHYLNLAQALLPLGVRVALLIHGLSKRSREEALKEIAAGEVDIVIGTHALIQEGVSFSRLGLVVIDEQHKFGVAQRAALRKKGASPDVLVMTATPIPRSLDLTIYGDLDVSVIDEIPAGRGEVTTWWFPESARKDVYEFIRKELAQGRQAYVVYPLIEESEKVERKAATQMFEEFQKEVFPEFKLGLVHGRMKAEDKDRVMKEFKEKRFRVLVSTTVIEVGIDIPAATIMLIENPECFGLSQLHQLRGRIGRGEGESYCILLGHPRTEAGEKRLTTLTNTRDGFQIAEYDLKLRGPGEFFGTRQHGLPELKIGNILTDLKLLEEAREEAFELIRQDPALKDETSLPIKENLKQKFRVGIELS